MRCTSLGWMILVASCFAVSAVAAEPAAESAGSVPQLVSVQKIWDQGEHNAFTDLIRFRDAWFCSFRESAGHVGGDGEIRVLTSPDGEIWKSAALIAEQGIDLRDPKLSITPDGRLMIVAGGSIYNGTKTLQGRQPRVMFSADGVKWTEPQKVLADGDWLWRVTWHDGVAYGVSYNTIDTAAKGDWSLTLYRSQNGVDWEKVTKLDVPGRANETTLRFLQSGKLVAMVRREGNEALKHERRGWIGVAESPYEKWSWTEIHQHFGGPNFLELPNGDLWAGTRGPGAKTILCEMTPTTLKPVLTLPSGGDCSYPGLVWHDGLLWMSYYSSHEGKTSIYLAKIRLPEKTADVQ